MTDYLNQPGSFPAHQAPSGYNPDAALFAFDKFLVNQKVLSLNSKYCVFNEDEKQLFYVDRPALKVKAHVGIYTDDSKSKMVLNLVQDSALTIINSSFTLFDESGKPIAYFKRQGWKSMLRRTWKILDATGSEIAIAEEDSLIKAILRRLPLVEIIGDLLRTNFVITRNGNVIGEFIRRFTLGDKYVLDLTQDRARTLDRRVAVALAILLDTAESR